MEFMAWYDIHKNDAFDFQYELLKYCRSDVDILRKCCLKFRELFQEITQKSKVPGIDPFENCLTIASACNLVFRRNFLEHESIGIIPSHGYRPEEKQSIMAYQWMSYLAHENQINIQHGRNYGEKHIGPYKVDGYYERDGEKVVLEFHGCFWHGCQKCFSTTTNYPVNDTMVDMIRGSSQSPSAIQVQDMKICRDITQTSVITRQETKDYRLVFDKRVINENYHTYPYGY
ncbi:hypothetical protein MAR_032389 [Mya arenaria]|uniref:DNA-directed DNA polymerase n=1 Tax=Mya arenaria TaxID=6604 RepID=A0ABY7F6G9_MYAAR|nr:hypothetical protein MAR_032389 [Mya arenaria]